MSTPLLVAFLVASLLILIALYLYFVANKYWKKFDRNYSHPKTFYGETFEKIRMKVNGMNFASFVELKYNDEGIFLRPSFPFLIFQKPIFVAWNDISEIKKRKDIAEVEIIVNNGDVSNSVSFSNETYQKLEEAFIKYKDYVKANL